MVCSGTFSCAAAREASDVFHILFISAWGSRWQTGALCQTPPIKVNKSLVFRLFLVKLVCEDGLLQEAHLGGCT